MLKNLFSTLMFESLQLFFFFAGSTIVSGSSDNTVRVWDVKTNACVLVLDSPHTDSVRCVQLKVQYYRSIINNEINIELEAIVNWLVTIEGA